MKLIHTDGTGYNGKECVACIYAEGEKPKLFISNRKYTKTQMEYYAIKTALERCEPHSKIQTHNNTPIQQIREIWKTTIPHFIELKKHCQQLIKQKKVTIELIDQNKNEAKKILNRNQTNATNYFFTKLLDNTVQEPQFRISKRPRKQNIEKYSDLNKNTFRRNKYTNTY